mmetsp:Transcript_44632/g.105848  ORF Transcript_44632/g.105848 Transcript_44632/m.105848 type:complete len:200 (+) Transcript_44632:3490-4089(+)
MASHQRLSKEVQSIQEGHMQPSRWAPRDHQSGGLPHSVQRRVRVRKAGSAGGGSRYLEGKGDVDVLKGCPHQVEDHAFRVDKDNRCRGPLLSPWLCIRIGFPCGLASEEKRLQESRLHGAHLQDWSQRANAGHLGQKCGGYEGNAQQSHCCSWVPATISAPSQFASSLQSQRAGVVRHVHVADKQGMRDLRASPGCRCH